MSKPGCWIRATSAAEHALARVIAGLSKTCARHPKTTLFFYAITMLACMAGVLRMQVEVATEKLWVDQNSDARIQLNYVSDTFDDTTRYNKILIAPRTANQASAATIQENIFTIPAIHEIFQLHQSILNTKATVAGTVSELEHEFTFEDICVKDASGRCLYTGLLEFWNHNYTLFNATVKTPQQLFDAVAPEAYPESKWPVSEADFADRVVTYRDDGSVERVFASAIYLSYSIKADISITSGEPKDKTAAFAWEKRLLDVVLDASTDETRLLDLYIQAERSIDDELEVSIGSDILLLVISYVIMIVFVSVSLGNPLSCVGRRALLGISDVFVIIFAIGGAYGTAMAIGIPFTSIAQTVPFILVGIGIDDAYVITAAFDRALKINKLGAIADVPERIHAAMLRAGMAITVTSLTDVLAFLLGSITRLPAIVYFCQYAGISVFFIYVAHITAFPALLALDAKRQFQQRADCVVCCKWNYSTEHKQQETRKSSIADLTEFDDPEYQQDERNVAQQDSDAPVSRFGAFLKNRYAPFLLKNHIRLLVVTCYLALTGFAALVCTEIGTEFELKDLTPDESYVRDFFDAQEVYFGSARYNGLPTKVYFKQVDYHDAMVQLKMQHLANKVQNASTVDKDIPLINWHLSFTQWANEMIANYPNQVEFTADDFQAARDETVNKEYSFLVGDNVFYAALKQFLETDAFKRFNTEIVWNSEGTRLLASRFTGFHVNLIRSYHRVEALEEMQDLASKSDLVPAPFIVSDPYIFFDQYRIIMPEMIQNLGLVLAAVVAICTITLVHPGGVLILVVVLGSVFVDLLASLRVWDLDLNSITSTNTVLAIGIVIDGTAHIIHTFGLQNPKLARDERVANALGEIGPSVCLGLLTTFLGVSPLAFASSTVFRTFFQQFLSIVVVGGVHGLIFLPVILSFVGPALPQHNIPSDTQETTQMPRKRTMSGFLETLGLGARRTPASSVSSGVSTLSNASGAWLSYKRTSVGFKQTMASKKADQESEERRSTNKVCCSCDCHHHRVAAAAAAANEGEEPEIVVSVTPGTEVQTV